ncbi:Probable NADH kinase [Seminavis robusta]|uniref:Probable NADH kinase n=1 Tax=Seminavis robusta TaxID=568900 RepID=A0A9N8H8E5_9STRA|nr:Probable NADH kinase [Seminavis robusta]|eukprot:Sro89_g047030.1 Probable NADH kinase (403) ;mRNA; r:89288-90785
MSSAAALNVGGRALKHRNLLLVIKQTAFEEYSQLKLRGQAPKALRWKRLEKRYKAHKQCVNDLLTLLRRHKVNFSCVNRVELDRQHLADVDLMVAVGGDGTVLSSAHFLDHGTIPLLGINSDPNSQEDRQVVKKKTDERRSHGALCMLTATNMEEKLEDVLFGEGKLRTRTRIRCKVKSTFAETRLVPALNDLLIANPSPAAVSRLRMGWLHPIDGGTEEDMQRNPYDIDNPPSKNYSKFGTVTRFGGIPYSVSNSLNIWSSGMWVCTPIGSTAAMAAAGGQIMIPDTTDLQYLIREHMIEPDQTMDNGEPLQHDVDNGLLADGQKMHLRWNSQKGRIFIDGSHLTHNLELGDEILIDNLAPPLQMYVSDEVPKPLMNENVRARRLESFAEANELDSFSKSL